MNEYEVMNLLIILFIIYEYKISIYTYSPIIYKTTIWKNTIFWVNHCYGSWQEQKDAIFVVNKEKNTQILFYERITYRLCYSTHRDLFLVSMRRLIK